MVCVLRTHVAQMELQSYLLLVVLDVTLVGSDFDRKVNKNS